MREEAEEEIFQPSKHKLGRTHAAPFRSCCRFYRSSKFLYEAEPLAMNIPDKNGDTPLNSAASRGDLKLTELLLSYDADKDIPNNKGETPLTKASQGAFDEVGKLIGRHQQTQANDPQQSFGSKSGNILSRMSKRY
ncbi:hypothetical protein V2G26_018754 [Clonostachys chloroleuca]